MTMRTAWRLSGVVFLGFVATCSSDSTAPLVPTAMTVVSGNSQVGPVGTLLAESLTVRVADQNGMTLAGAAVSWTVTSGGGSVSPGSTVTNADGIARAAWTLGTLSGNQSVSASVGSLTPTTFSATAFVPPSFVLLSSGGITLDAHTCGIWDIGETYCWGAGSYGRLGNGAAANSTLPVRVSGAQPFVAITSGGYHTCALTLIGEAYCWGRNNVGQLGNGGTSDATSPVRVSGPHAFVAIDAGAYHTCALTETGTAYCWGANSFGQLGDGTTSQRAVPTAVSGGLLFVGLSAGGNTEQSHTCARTASGAGYCWGSNGFGQLGITGSNSATPVQVSGGLSFVTVVAGGYHTCGRVSAALHCWGYNAYGQLGSSGGSSSQPRQVSGGLSFKSVNAGGWTTCAATQGDSGYCWGWGHYGERGDGVNSDAQSAPTAILGGLNFALITSGPYHTCGETNDAKWYCWGYNADGQLGNGSTTHRSTPTSVSVP